MDVGLPEVVLHLHAGKVAAGGVQGSSCTLTAEPYELPEATLVAPLQVAPEKLDASAW